MVIVALCIIAAAWTAATWADHHMPATARARALDPEDAALAADLAAARARHPSTRRRRLDVRV